MAIFFSLIVVASMQISCFGLLQAFNSQIECHVISGQIFWQPEQRLLCRNLFKAGKMLNLDIAVTYGEGLRVNQAADGQINYEAGVDFFPLKNGINASTTKTMPWNRHPEPKISI